MVLVLVMVMLVSVANNNDHGDGITLVILAMFFYWMIISQRCNQYISLPSDFESLDDDTQVVATARGTFTSEGGVLSSPESGVSIHIPEGAIPCGIEQEIYFKVCKDNNIMPPLDTDKGNARIYVLYLSTTTT